MRRVLGIVKLTLAEGIRMRIVLVFLLVLVVLIVRMPFTVRGDETLAGKLQNFLAYAMGAMSVLLSLTTIFLACSTLAGEFRSRVLHMVVTKPVTRFEILLGKWIGVNLLALIVLTLGGGAIYGLAYYMATRPVEFERDRYRIRDTVWTARVAARPVPQIKEADEAAKQYVKERIQRGELPAAREEIAVAQKREELLRVASVVPDGEFRTFDFTDLTPPERSDATIQVRYKIVVSPMTFDETITVGWVFLDVDTNAWLSDPIFTRERANQVQQFLVRAEKVVKNGKARLMVLNPPDADNHSAMIFEGPKSLQILYRVGGFEENFVRALLVIQLRLALLSAVGLFFATFTSFPVACFCALSFYVICLGSPFWLESIGANMGNVDAKIDPYGALGPTIRTVLVPSLKAAFPNFGTLDGASDMIDGLIVPTTLIGAALVRLLAYGVVLLLGAGWLIFSVREVAEVQV